MVTIRIMNEYLHGPVWTCVQGTGIETKDLPLVANDKEVSRLNEQIGAMFDSYYEFDSHDEACWFNEEQEKADKEKMLDLLGKLNARLAEINDGSFDVVDFETPRLMRL